MPFSQRGRSFATSTPLSESSYCCLFSSIKLRGNIRTTGLFTMSVSQTLRRASICFAYPLQGSNYPNATGHNDGTFLLSNITYPKLNGVNRCRYIYARRRCVYRGTSRSKWSHTNASESGNMLIMVLSYTQRTNDTSLVDNYVRTAASPPSCILLIGGLRTV